MIDRRSTNQCPSVMFPSCRWLERGRYSKINPKVSPTTVEESAKDDGALNFPLDQIFTIHSKSLAPRHRGVGGGEKGVGNLLRAP